MKMITSRRNDAYLRICTEIQRAEPSSTIRQISEKALAAMSGQPYNLSYDYAMRKLGQYRRGTLSESQRPRWARLSDRVEALERKYHLTTSQALQRELTDGTAPARPMSASYARRLYQKLRSDSVRPRRTTSSESV